MPVENKIAALEFLLLLLRFLLPARISFFRRWKEAAGMARACVRLSLVRTDVGLFIR